MRWYEGDIAQAVATSKTQNAVFVVYVEGKDAKSTNLTSIINENEITSKLESDTFVAIKVEAGSVSHNQFTAIFKAVPVPSIFFIGKNGKPIDIVTDSTNTDLMTRINKVIELHTGTSPDTISQTAVTSSEDFIKSEQQTSAAAEKPEDASENDVSSMISEAATTSTALAESLDENAAFLEEEKNKLSKEDKIQRAKELVELKRAAKTQEEEELARAKELERRKMGQDVQKMRRWQQDQDMKVLMEERQRTKNEEKAARDRILAQIAQDKADRAAKFSTSPPAAPVPYPANRPIQTTIPNANTARLQFRMPDGSSRTNEFDSTATLFEVREFVMQNMNIPFRNFTLSTTFPRREFTIDENDETLRDLELCPNAVLLVLQGHSSGVVTSNTSGGIFSLFWLLVSPIMSIYGFFRNLVFGAPENVPPPTEPRNTSSPALERNKQSASNSSLPETQTSLKRKEPDTSVLRRQGSSNIHRLSDRTDSDDDNNTWNGNSTQQM